VPYVECVDAAIPPALRPSPIPAYEFMNVAIVGIVSSISSCSYHSFYRSTS
jgi:hypothetical protein